MVSKIGVFVGTRNAAMADEVWKEDNQDVDKLAQIMTELLTVMRESFWELRQAVSVPNGGRVDPLDPPDLLVKECRRQTQPVWSRPEDIQEEDEFGRVDDFPITFRHPSTEVALQVYHRC